MDIDQFLSDMSSLGVIMNIIRDTTVCPVSPNWSHEFPENTEILTHLTSYPNEDIYILLKNPLELYEFLTFRNRGKHDHRLYVLKYHDSFYPFEILTKMHNVISSKRGIRSMKPEGMQDLTVNEINEQFKRECENFIRHYKIKIEKIMSLEEGMFHLLTTRFTRALEVRFHPSDISQS